MVMRRGVGDGQRDYWIYGLLAHVCTWGGGARMGLCPSAVVRESFCYVSGKGWKDEWDIFIIWEVRKWGEIDREGDLSWHGLVFLSLWCYSGLFHGEGFLNISVCMNGFSCLVLSTSFTAVNSASSFELSTSVCVSVCILICSYALIQKGGGWAVCIKCFISFELCIYECWQLCWSMLSLTGEIYYLTVCSVCMNTSVLCVCVCEWVWIRFTGV